MEWGWEPPHTFTVGREKKMGAVRENKTWLVHSS